MSTLKHKGKGPQSLTANELREGFSVWLTPELEWSRDFSEALKTEDEALIEKMKTKGDVDEEANLVVGVYFCLLYTSPSPRDRTRSRMPFSA